MVHAPLVLMLLAVMLAPIPLVPRTYVDIDCADGTGATGTDAGPAAVDIADGIAGVAVRATGIARGGTVRHHARTTAVNKYQNKPDISKGHGLGGRGHIFSLLQIW